MKRGAAFCCAVLMLVVIGSLAFAGDRVEHRAIVISNDYEFTVENGVCSGSGELDDPYVIENWAIDAGYDEYGIRIHGTTRAFIIRNVEISGAAKSAVHLGYVRNGTIEDCQFEGNWTGVTLSFAKLNRISRCTFSDNTDGIHFYFSSANQILGNTFDRNDTAIWLDASNDNELIGNHVVESCMGVYLNLGSTANYIVDNAFVDNLHHAHTDDPNHWDDGAAGNYWGGYEAIDAEEDGIWDSPYQITSDGDQDGFPLVTHPLIPTPPPATCET
jgi:parallel beta-helix repeat protein